MMMARVKHENLVKVSISTKGGVSIFFSHFEVLFYRLLA